MENFAKVAIVAVAMATVSQASEAREWKLKVSMDQYTTHYFENQLDHFNSNDDRSYKQRYWYNDGFKVDNGPCFLYICGEWTCSPPDD